MSEGKTNPLLAASSVANPLSLALPALDSVTDTGPAISSAESDGTLETHNTLQSPFIIATKGSKVSDSGGVSGSGDPIQKIITLALLSVVGLATIRALT